MTEQHIGPSTTHSGAPDADDAQTTVDAIRALFATWDGWREWSPNYDPNELCTAIARLVGELQDDSALRPQW